MFGLTTTKRLRAVADALIAMQAQRDNARAARDAAAQRAETEKERAITSGRLASELLAERDAAHALLAEIAAMETPGSAPAAKRMAAKARAGVPEKLANAA